MTRARAGLLLAGIFLLGAACGALATATFGLHRLHHGGFSHDRAEEFVMRRLTRRLDLDETQRLTLQQVVHATRLKLEAVHDEVMPRIDAILDDACDEIKPSLRPEQVPKLDEVRAEAKDRLHHQHAP